MWGTLKRALWGGDEARRPLADELPTRLLTRQQASDLISCLPTIERISSFYDGPDLRSATAKRAWNAAADSLASAGSELAHWHFDALVACGRFDEALSAVPPPAGQRRSLQASKTLALKLHLGLPAAALDIVTLFGPRLTKFGLENLDGVTRYLAIQLAADQQASSLIEMWALDAHEIPHGMPIFNGHMSYLIVKPPRGLSFDRSPTAERYCLKLMRDAENAWREEGGIPAVGQGWISETRLYHEIRSAFEDLDVEQHARPDWLRPQHLDIYIPAIGTAIEYQGAQHDQPVAFFGGEEAFLRTVERDQRKQKRCRRHGVRLIYVREGYALQEVLDQVRAAVGSPFEQP